MQPLRSMKMKELIKLSHGKYKVGMTKAELIDVVEKPRQQVTLVKLGSTYQDKDGGVYFYSRVYAGDTCAICGSSLTEGQDHCLALDEASSPSSSTKIICEKCYHVIGIEELWDAYRNQDWRESWRER